MRGRGSMTRRRGRGVEVGVHKRRGGTMTGLMHGVVLVGGRMTGEETGIGTTMAGVTDAIVGMMIIGDDSYCWMQIWRPGEIRLVFMSYATGMWMNQNMDI